MDRSPRNLSRQLPLAIGATLIFIGIVCVIGWIADIALFRSVVASWPSMKVNTGLGIAMLGIALCAHRRYPRAVDALGTVVTALGIATILEYAFGWNLGLDQFLITDKTTPTEMLSSPGRMAPETALAFLCIGLPMALSRHVSDKWLNVTQYVAGLGGGIGFYQLLSFSFEAPDAYFVYTRMAIHTAISFMLAAVGCQCLETERGVIVILRAKGMAGILIRRFLPAGIVIPVTFWWLRMYGQRLGVFPFELGVILCVTVTVGVLILLILNTAHHLRHAEERQAEIQAEMRSTRALFNAIIENIPDMIFVKDAKDLRFILFNQAGEKLLGYPRDALIGKSDYDFFPKEQADFFTAKDRKILESQGVLDIPQEPIDTKNGRRLLHTRKIAITDESGPPRYLLGVSEDITARKEAEARIAEQQDMLIYSSKMSALGEMAGGIAHEINNPLAIICGHTEELREALADDKVDAKRVHEVSELIEQTAFRISKIVKGLRTFARDGRNEPFKDAPVSTLIDDTLSFCREKFSSQGVSLHIGSVPASLEIECRAVQISQVLVNLLNNAFDAVQNTVEKWIRMEVSDLGDTVEIRICDSGPGVPEEIKDRIFMPFFTTKDPGKGTGLGLSISAGIADGHGGSLTLAPSAPTCFSLVLPKRQNVHQTMAA